MSSTLTDRVYAALAAEEHDALYIAAHAAETQTERDLDLIDWGMAVGIAFGIARGEDPYESPEAVIARAEQAASEAWARRHTVPTSDSGEVK